MTDRDKLRLINEKRRELVAILSKELSPGELTKALGLYDEVAELAFSEGEKATSAAALPAKQASETLDPDGAEASGDISDAALLALLKSSPSRAYDSSDLDADIAEIMEEAEAFRFGTE